MNKLLAPIVALALLGCRTAPAPFSTDALERHIAYLASDELEGRDAGTPGGDRAESYLLSAFRGAGLAACGTQEFTFVAGARSGTENSFAVGAEKLSADDFRPYPFSASGSVDRPAVFAGFGIAVSDLKWDDFQGIDVKEKLLVVLSGSSEGVNPHGDFAPHQSPRAKALKARELGAAGIVILVEDLPPFEGEEISRDVGIPVAAARRGAAAKLLGLDLEAAEKTLKEGKSASRPLEKGASLRTDVKLEERRARNVYGWLPGSDPGLPCVVVGAHHDHLGRGGAGSMRRERRGEIHNGADDNASGAAGVVELARRLRARGRLPRSILFVTFGAEERGLLGSKYLVDHLAGLEAPPGTTPGRTPAAMVNLDMIGRLRDRKLILSGSATSPDFPPLLAAAESRCASPGVPPLHIIDEPPGSAFGSSDHQSFYSAKVPILFFFTGAHKEYHTPDDDLYRTGPDGKKERLINLEGMVEVLRLVEEILAELAARLEAPAYKAGVELTQKLSFKVKLRLMPDYGAEVEGMRIAEVSPGGPAALAGLEKGDVIVRFGATPVRSVQDYMVGLEKAKPGEEIEVEYLRGAERRKARLVPEFFGK